MREVRSTWKEKGKGSAKDMMEQFIKMGLQWHKEKMMEKKIKQKKKEKFLLSTRLKDITKY